MKISIVLLSYNHFNETTKSCFESLIRDPDFDLWELIVVDNASRDGSAGQLAALQTLYPSVRFLFNRENLGFAGGVNTGIKHASGDIICLLNSDTICPDGMLSRLASHIEKDESIGMVAPVSNAAGNEQAIYISSLHTDQKILEGVQYANCGGPASVDAYRLDFCCVAISRRALDAVGLLDEGFSLGYYEDFDYSLRMKENGFRLLVAEDAFIYHHGGASFSVLPAEARELRKTNKQRIIKKHGRKTAFPHTRQCNFSVLEQYLERRQQGDEVSEYRVMNRIKYGFLDTPKNPIKKWGYLQSMHALARKFNFGMR